MKVTCPDRERIFRDGSVDEWRALEQHANDCADCRNEIQAWKQLSAAAEDLRQYDAPPALWARIESSLQQQAAARKRGRFWNALIERLTVPHLWQGALAGALVVALAVGGGYVWTLRAPGGAGEGSRLLKDRALAEVERTERDYTRAIDKLAAEAKPQFDAPASPLMSSYREKLMVLDGAIDELRAQAGQNPSNGHLRRQLLAMYQEKQQTLQDLLETKP